MFGATVQLLAAVGVYIGTYYIYVLHLATNCLDLLHLQKATCLPEGYMHTPGVCNKSSPEDISMLRAHQQLAPSVRHRH
jgi:hypothetical protein